MHPGTMTMTVPPARTFRPLQKLGLPVEIGPESSSPPERIQRIGMRWAAIAATIALLLTAAGGSYLASRGPSEGGPTRVAGFAASPVATPGPSREIASRCDAVRNYTSTLQGQTYIADISIFGQAALTADRLQLQRWVLGPNAVASFTLDQFDGVSGMALDTVAAGIYTATFEGPVVVTTRYGDGVSHVYTTLEAKSNTVELGPGESVLFEVGTQHSVSNALSSRSLAVERAVFHSGDRSTQPLIGSRQGTGESGQASGQFFALDSNAPGLVSARIDGTGTISIDDPAFGWERTLIILEYVMLYQELEQTSELVPPCEPLDSIQVRNLDEIADRSGNFSGYLVWIGQGGMG